MADGHIVHFNVCTDLGNSYFAVSLQLVSQVLPDGGHSLTMSTPGGKKLHKMVALGNMTGKHGCCEVKQRLKNKFEFFHNYVYNNNPKFLDRQVWANSVDPDQNVVVGAVQSGSILFAIPSVSYRHITV